MKNDLESSRNVYFRGCYFWVALDPTLGTSSGNRNIVLFWVKVRLKNWNVSKSCFEYRESENVCSCWGASLISSSTRAAISHVVTSVHHNKHIIQTTKLLVIIKEPPAGRSFLAVRNVIVINYPVALTLLRTLIDFPPESLNGTSIVPSVAEWHRVPLRMEHESRWA